MVKKSFNAYQVELKYTEKDKSGNEVMKYKWDFNSFVKILEYIYNQPEKEKLKKNSGWALSLDDLRQNKDCLLGALKFVEYGFKSNLYHVDTHVSRNNPRDLREGEEKYVYFYVRREDGLLLLQNDIKLNRAKLDDYIETKGKVSANSLSLIGVNIANLLKREFFEEIGELEKIKKVILEVKSKGLSGENEVVQQLQDTAEDMEATHVQLSYSAKRVKEGMSLSRVIPFIKKYKGKQGITSIKVVGEQAGAEKNVYVNKYSEKYPIILKTDENNMLDKEDVYKKIQAVGKSRESLRG